jgi:hypothetical protein
MSATPLKFQSGDTLSIRDDGGTIALWGVVERKRGGWLLKPHSGADPRTWSDDEIHDAYSARQVTHFPCNTANLPKQVNEVIERTWEYWPQAARREAERRILYVRMVDTIKNHHFTLMDAFKAAAEEVYEANWERWHQEDIEDSARRAIEEKQRKQRNARAAEITLPAVPKPRRYSPYAVRDWYLRWNSLGHDIRILLPHFHLRGRFGPRKNTERGDRPDAYKLMRVAINQFYMTMPRKLKKYAYRKYVELCEAAHIEPLSDGAFRKFINSSYTERQEFEKRYGKRAAYLKFGIFERTKPPERPLEEIEVDHCLIDLIVVHPITKRPMGRPWLTVLIDRATRVILGAHLSFEVPSYAALQRAIAHSIWPKDLCGIEGLEHDWPCHGVYDPVERAQYSLSEISFMLLKWIVDEYHETKHDTLGCKPIEKWRELTERYPVRPVPNFDHIIRLTGEVIDRQISNVGIHWEGLLYADKKKLEPLLARRGGLQKIWRILLDPYDVGEVWILDDETGEWLVVPCTDQAISRGVSKHQHLVHKKIAQNSIPKGAHVTTADLVRAKAVAEQEAADLFNEGTKTSTAAKAARYATSGAYFTPLASAGFSSALTPTSPVLKGAAIEIRSPDSSAIRRESESISAPLAADIEDDIEAMVKLWDKANT